MKKILLVTILLCASASTMFAQKHEIGVFLGGANGITDIGRTDFINPLPKQYDKDSPSIPIALGLLYRFNLNPQHTLRLNIDYANIIDNDKIAAENYRYDRGLKYAQDIYEASVVFEYNFFPINTEQERAHSPYIFFGGGVFAYNYTKYDVFHTFNNDSSLPTSPTDFQTTISKNNELKFSYTIPFGAGYKYKFNYNWVVGAEVGFRPTFIDNLENGFAKPEDFTFHVEPGLQGYPGIVEEIIERNDQAIFERQVGDYTNKDWYVFTGLHLTYTFGRPACFCD